MEKIKGIWEQIDERVSLVTIMKALHSYYPQCTCKEDSKQRALCPVCDKEKYKEMKNDLSNELKK